MNLIDIQDEYNLNQRNKLRNKLIIAFSIFLLIVISANLFATASIDVNITNTYANITDTFNIVKYMLGGVILIMFLAIFYINILYPKKTVYVDD